MGTGRSLNKRRVDSQKLYTYKQISKLFNGELTQTSSWKMKFTRILDAATDTEQTHHILSNHFKTSFELFSDFHLSLFKVT